MMIRVIHRCQEVMRYPVEMIKVVRRCLDVSRQRYPVEMFRVVHRCQEVFRHRGIQLRCSKLSIGVWMYPDTEISS